MSQHAVILRRSALAALLLALATARFSFGDILILNDGTRLEGLVTTSSLVPNVVIFSDHVSKSLQIPRARVQQIISEPQALSRSRIAKALAREGKLEAALEQIREARRLAPDDVALQEEEEAILRALALKSAKEAEVKTGEYRGLLDKIRQAMESRQFDKALPWFAVLETQGIPPDLAQEAARLAVQFYDQWGDSRADKQDTQGAIECYEKVMELDPNAKDTYTKLMRLYEKISQPGADANRTLKLQEFLEAKVAENPNDLDARLRLANLLYAKRDWDGALTHYLAVYRDTATTGAKQVPLYRVEARLIALLDGRHRRSAEQKDYDKAIEQFREYQSLFPDVDPEPLAIYEYEKRAREISPQDDDAHMELARFCTSMGLAEHARKEVLTVLRNNPKHPEALKILTGWAQSDLAEIEMAFENKLFAQIPLLVSVLHERYPVDRYPSLQPIHDAADDVVEKARNEIRNQRRESQARASDLADQGDQNFERGVQALQAYRSGADTPYRSTGYSPPNTNISGSVTRTAGSYKADATMYLERALRYYREALALDPSLGDPARKDLKRKIADCNRYLSLLKSQRITRLPPGQRSARRHDVPRPSTRPGYGYPPIFPYVYPSPYAYSNPYAYSSPYGYSYPYVTPITPYAPYGFPYAPYNPSSPTYPFPFSLLPTATPPPTP